MVKMKKALAVLSSAAIGMSLLTAVPASAAENVMTADEIIKAMGTGWNLGNSLDAIGSGLSSETAWGNPKTSKELIDKVHSLGFDSIRVPVSWGRHMNDKYEIDSAWLDRVQEVVDYAYDQDMYVIINIHHDNDLKDSSVGKNFFYPSDEYKEQSLKFVESVWTQVSEKFKDYDQHLIFETLNEPRLTYDKNEWWFTFDNPEPKVKTAIDIINQMNAKGVETIRAAGGKNENRLILCPGYAASLDGARHSLFKLPEDKNDLVAVELHGYAPYGFSMDANATATYDDSVKKDLYSLFNNIRTGLIDKGYKVVIDETGVIDKRNSAERAKWAKDYKAFTERAGIGMFLWDNNGFLSANESLKSEKFGLINRSTLEASDMPYLKGLVTPTTVTQMYDDGVITTYPSITETGVKTYTDVATGATKTETIAKLIDISGATLTAKTDGYSYTGLAIRPTVTIKLGGKTLKAGTDYNVVYQNNNKAGTATINVKGTGLYGGSVKKNFTIAAMNVSMLTISSPADAAYTGKAITPELTVKRGTKVLEKDTDYTLSYKNNINAGTATVTVTGKGNYTGSVSKTFKITAKSIAKASVTGLTSKVYTGKAIKPAVTVKLSGKTLVKGTDYTVSYKNNKKVGKATVTIKGKGAYTGTITKKFTIKPKASRVLSAASTKTKKMTVKLKKTANVTGYQIAYSTSSKFTKAATKTVSTTKLTKTISKLKKGKTYYVKVRTYKTVGKTRYYSSYSKYRKVKVK